MSPSRLFAITALLAVLVLTGCSNKVNPPQVSTPKEQPKEDEVSIERAKLTSTDRDLVETQEWCVVNTDERLGSMGPPIKLELKGQPVFVCCKGCRRRAEANPDLTLAKVEELKIKSKSEKAANK